MKEREIKRRSYISHFRYYSIFQLKSIDGWCCEKLPCNSFILNIWPHFLIDLLIIARNETSRKCFHNDAFSECIEEKQQQKKLNRKWNREKFTAKCMKVRWTESDRKQTTFIECAMTHTLSVLNEIFKLCSKHNTHTHTSIHTQYRLWGRDIHKDPFEVSYFN